MNTRAIRAVVWKDLRVALTNKGVVVPMIIVPVVLLVALPAMAALVPSATALVASPMAGLDTFMENLPDALLAELAGYNEGQQLVILTLLHFLAPMYLIIPLMVASVIAADSFAGEKERKTLEALIHTPATDWELFLADQGYGGQEYAGGMTQNSWVSRPWHLPEHCHPINWATREMCRFVRRRDPRKPGFWYLSFSAPHPPLWPLQPYLDMYRDVDLGETATGSWSHEFDKLPAHVKRLSNPDNSPLHRGRPHEIELARRSFYATLTHIDHQIRVLIGYLGEAGLLDNTIIAFTSDHGHMAGEHGLWCMTPFYEMSAKIPLIVVPPRGHEEFGVNATDDRFAEFGDIGPTLLDLAGIPIPEHMDQLSLAGDEKREYVYGEHGEGVAAMRMIRRDRYKLIYFARGNRVQLFDVDADPRECQDLADQAGSAAVRQELEQVLISRMYGEDLEWVQEGKLVGLPDAGYEPVGDRRLRGQRGLRFM